jgi:alpha-tubulin suppressor-like RCC1 family protein
VGGTPTVSTKSFVDVSAMDDRTCGVRYTDGAIECWGERFAADPPSGAFSRVAVGGSHGCGLTAGGAITCWGDNANGQTSVPPGVYRGVTLGTAHSCGYRMDQSIVCWGDNRLGQASPVPSNYAQLTAGGDRTCALGFDGVASCWGYMAGAQVRPAAQFVNIATGAYRSCGERKDRMAISCWNPDGSAPPFERPGAFTQISVGPSQICAVDANSVACWNYNAGPLETPTERFTEVSVGYGHVCALRDDRKVVCWGNNDKRQATPP